MTLGGSNADINKIVIKASDMDEDMLVNFNYYRKKSKKLLSKQLIKISLKNKCLIILNTNLIK